MSNRIQTLGQYIRKALDVNKDGAITFKDFLGLFPNNAIAIAVLFVDAVVLVAEYRVWDVGMRISNDIFKAMGFVLVSAIPFYLGQIFWLYPRAVWSQKLIAVLLVIGGLYMSAQFGLADLSQTYDVTLIISTVIRLTVAYIVLVLLYVLIDPGIKAHRAMVQARAAAALEREYQVLTREMLTEWQATKALEKDTIELFGDEDAVIAQLEAMRGKKPNKGNDQGNQKKTPTNHTIDDYLEKTNMTLEQAQKRWRGKEYSEFAQNTNTLFDRIDGGNMRAIFGELVGNADPSQAVRSNGRNP